MLKTCYTLLHADYADALNRFGTEARLEKYLVKFLADTGFADLSAALERQDEKSAQLAAHSLKGTSRLLGLVRLGAASERLEYALRGGKSADIPILLRQVQAEYAQTIAAIHSLQAAGEGASKSNG